MAYLDWNESYSVNIKEFDQQHRKLVSLLNELFEAMKAGSAKQVLGAILNSLIDYTEKHFAAEEALMEKYDFPELWRHRNEHIHLTKQVLAFKEKYERGEASLSVEMSGFLKAWLTDHIMKTDKRYTEFLNKKGVY